MIDLSALSVFRTLPDHVRPAVRPPLCNRCPSRDGTQLARMCAAREIALMLNRHSMPAIRVVVLTTSADFEQLVQAAFGSSRFALSIVREGLRGAAATLGAGDAGIVIVDLDSTQRDEFMALEL